MKRISNSYAKRIWEKACSRGSAELDEWPINAINMSCSVSRCWIYIRIPSHNLGSVVLSHHVRNGIVLVPPKGRTVKHAAAFLRLHEKLFRKADPRGHESILFHASCNHISPIFLINKPINALRDHRHLVNRSSELIHIDGLHRLISLYYPKYRPHLSVDCIVAKTSIGLHRP